MMQAPWEYLRDHGSVILGTSSHEVKIGKLEDANLMGETVFVYIRRLATKEEYEAQIPGMTADPDYVAFYEISAD